MIPTITSAQYDALCNVIDRAKVDGEEDTDCYAQAALAALGLEVDDDRQEATQ